MRKVYTPPASGGGWHWMILGSMAITLAVFLVLPLSQMISSVIMSEEDQFAVLTEQPPPPPPPEVEKEQPPEEEKPEEQPELENLQELNRSFDFDLGDVGGIGGFIGDPARFAAGAQDLIKGGVLDVTELDSQPVLMSATQPTYPTRMQKARIEGSVTILFLLDEDGKVEEPRVETSSRPDFEQPALDAIKRWKFKPGTKDGQPVKTYMRQPINFRMQT